MGSGWFRVTLGYTAKVRSKFGVWGTGVVLLELGQECEVKAFKHHSSNNRESGLLNKDKFGLV